MNLQEALTWARSELTPTSDAPGIDSERLLLFVLKKTDTSFLQSHNDQQLTSQEEESFAAVVKQRLTGKPLVYILGAAEFYGRPFYVNENVLIPRPETEELITKALEYIKTKPPLTVADIGTGSGCIAITLALELPPSYTIIATDISSAALKVAGGNAKRHGVSNRIEFLEGNMLEPLKNRKIDLIVSNPPYIPTKEIEDSTYSTEISKRGLKFEPRLALDGGVDGQRYIEKIKKAGIPVILEVTGGRIATTHLKN